MAFFDAISLLYLLNSVRVLWKLVKNWHAFWDDDVTRADLALATQVAFFVFIPLGVFLHEAGHTLATWQVGGEVIDFQWRGFWGFIIPFGNFTLAQSWWISFSGNLVSILLGLLPIFLLTRARTRMRGELYYAFAKQQLFYALIWYPGLTLIGFNGDWVRIYDFSIVPFAQITLVLHLALLYSLWRLDKSVGATRWRIARDPESLSTLQKLEAAAEANPNDVQAQANLAYYYHQMDERGPSKHFEKRAVRLAPDDTRLKLIQAFIAYDQQHYPKAAQAAKAAFGSGLSQKDQLPAHRVLASALMNMDRRAEALTHFDFALSLSPEDSDLYYWRAVLKRLMGRLDEARSDFEQAARLAPDEQSRKQAQRELKDT